MKNTVFNWERAGEILSIPTGQKTEDTLIELSEIMVGVNFLSRLRIKYTNAIHIACVKILKLMKFIKGQFLYEKGDYDNNYYIILNGTVSFLYNNNNKNDELNDANSESSEKSIDDKRINLRTRNRLVNINSDMMDEYLKHRINDFYDEDYDEKSIKNPIELENAGLIEFILQGETFDNHVEAKTLTAGGDFGYECFFNDKPRYINAVAKTNLLVATIGKKDFLEVFQDIKDKINNENCEFLHKVSMFQNWPKVNIMKIASLFRVKVLNKGQFLYKQFEVPNAVFFVKKGDFKITQAIKKNYDGLMMKDHKKNIKFRTSNFYNKVVDLVIKSEKEVLGAEEILCGIDYRKFSCMCISAIAEVLYVTKVDFISKLVRADTSDDASKNFFINKEWLENRSQYLDDFTCKTIDVATNKKDTNFYGDTTFRQPIENLSFDGKVKNCFDSTSFSMYKQKNIKYKLWGLKVSKIIKSNMSKKTPERAVKSVQSSRNSDGQFKLRGKFLQNAICPPVKKNWFNEKINIFKKDLIRGVPPNFLVNSRAKVHHRKSKSDDMDISRIINRTPMH
ncbi:hypothetical protein SteCoe_15591 [Stentor coeruleus]|uniref:Cyclic nucleotide-binding domain-containing protein n=1 Tax=Stentor coeruleus TaxID=5963 RepID=A0A1R2C380_9CILI|nr:hypothetical protein SteCoe_15591 [Stentor coeruleus]